MGCFVFDSCGSNIFGHLDENLLDAVSNVASESDCKSLCSANGACSWYTYFFPNDTMNHEHCFLQTQFLPPSQLCDSCVSGPLSCDQGTKCSLTLGGGGDTRQSLLLTNTSVPHNISVTGPQSCELRILLVGGGGRDGDGDSYGGAGSGLELSRNLREELGEGPY